MNEDHKGNDIKRTLRKTREDYNVALIGNLTNALLELTHITEEEMHVPTLVYQIHNNKILEDDLLQKYPEVKEIYFQIVNINNLKNNIFNVLKQGTTNEN